ncbi:serine hydrolase domain-containing protein [Tsukamurella soli]|uniref:Serine hydrolase n=1 Tax=Tsukamurella soli TaxID=644556 RepID=A0ABP8JEA0_9ACTN
MTNDAGDAAVGADARNWQTPPYNRWAFWNVDRILPVRTIPRAAAPHPLPERPAPDLLQTTLTDVTGAPTTVGAVFERTYTDAYLIVRDGAVVAEWYCAAGGPERTHAIMSITKSIVGCVAGGLVADGLLDPERPVTDYATELAGSGYAGARVRDVLDMRTGVIFREEYLDPASEIRAMADWLGWQAPYGAPRAGGLYGFLGSLGRGGEHGGPFVYRSADSDVLGWVCERVAGLPMDVLIRERIWRPMGAAADALMLCDTNRTPVHDGGLAVTARDLARFGRVLAHGGVEPDGSSHVVPPRWLRQVWTVDAGARAAFAASPSEAAMPGGWYRNQFWVRPDARGHDVVLGIGIYGQLLFVDRATGTVGVKFSSWPAPQVPAYLEDTFRAFAAVAAGTAGTTSQRPPSSPPVSPVRPL